MPLYYLCVREREREAFYLMMLLIVKIVNEIRFSGRGIKHDYGPLVDWYWLEENCVWFCVVRAWPQPTWSLAQPLVSLAVLFKKFSGWLIKTIHTRYILLNVTPPALICFWCIFPFCQHAVKSCEEIGVSCFNVCGVCVCVNFLSQFKLTQNARNKISIAKDVLMMNFLNKNATDLWSF